MKLLKAAGLFVIIYLMFRAMSGWQFIVFVIVLAGIASFFLERKS